MELFDTHCHLQDPRLRPDVETILARAAAAGVSRLLCCGTEESDWDAVLEIARTHPAVRPALGLHPCSPSPRSTDWLERLRRRLLDSVAAVGEIGLDHYIAPRDEALQEAIFLAQLQLAVELNRPVSIHCRQAWGRMLELLQTVPLPAAGVILHSFSGARDLVEPLARTGAYFSFSGAITRPSNRKGPDAVRAVPWDRLLVETDAPDILPIAGSPPSAPAPLGPPNEPANLVCTVHRIAELRGVAPDEVARCTWQNAVALLGTLPGTSSPLASPLQ